LITQKVLVKKQCRSSESSSLQKCRSIISLFAKIMACKVLHWFKWVSLVTRAISIILSYFVR